MKIISKYKDYYDYLSGIYGEDPKLVLDRRGSKYSGFFLSLTEDKKYILLIGGFKIECYYRGGKMYYGEALRELADEDSQRHRPNNVFICSLGHRENVWVSTVIEPDSTNLNIKKNIPILLCAMPNGWRSRDYEIVSEYPKLEDLQLGSFVEPFKVYQMISEWLAKRVDETELSTTTTNEQKIENKGFDKKTSFRPNMKR